VLDAGRNDKRRTILQRILFAVENRLAKPGLDSKNLIDIMMHFHSDLFPRLDRHDDQLRTRGGLQHFAETNIIAAIQAEEMAAASHRSLVDAAGSQRFKSKVKKC